MNHEESALYTWLLHGYYMATTWVLHGYYMGTTWVMRVMFGSHMELETNFMSISMGT